MKDIMSSWEVLGGGRRFARSLNNLLSSSPWPSGPLFLSLSPPLTARRFIYIELRRSCWAELSAFLLWVAIYLKLLLQSPQAHELICASGSRKSAF
jgi:hypothetical protein